MLKRAEIKKGDTVTWRKKVDPTLEYVVCLNAKVIDIYEKYPDIEDPHRYVLIEVKTNNTINSPTVRFSVPLSDLESKSLIRDEDKYREYLNKRLREAQVVSPQDCFYLIEDEGEKIFDSVEDYLEECECDDREPNDFLWACNLVPIERISVDFFADSILENFDDDYSPGINGLSSLQEAIDSFYEANAHLQLIKTDYTRMVLVPKTSVNFE